MLNEDLKFFPQSFWMNEVFQQEAGAQFFHFRLARFVQIGEFISPAERDQELRLCYETGAKEARTAPPEIHRGEIDV